MLNKLQALRNKMKKKGKGFTLVELIVVIIIIAIIAAVAIPRIVAFQESARKSRINSEHRQLVTAIQSFMAQSDNTAQQAGKITGIEILKPYMNMNDESKNLATELAENGGGSAHKIANGKLTSTFTSTAASVESKTWNYTFAATTTGGAAATTPAPATGTNSNP